jgi:hypothetical protein
VASGEWRVKGEQWHGNSGKWPVNAKRGDRAVTEKCQNKANLLVVSVVLIVGML